MREVIPSASRAKLPYTNPTQHHLLYTERQLKIGYHVWWAMSFNVSVLNRHYKQTMCLTHIHRLSYLYYFMWHLEFPSLKIRYRPMRIWINFNTSESFLYFLFGRLREPIDLATLDIRKVVWSALLFSRRYRAGKPTLISLFYLRIKPEIFTLVAKHCIHWLSLIHI